MGEKPGKFYIMEKNLQKDFRMDGKHTMVENLKLYMDTNLGWSGTFIHYVHVSFKNSKALQFP